MTDFFIGDHATRIGFKYQPSEGRMYVSKWSANEEVIERLAAIRRANGGAKTMDGGRLAAQIPFTVFDMMEEGKVFGGKYQGIKSADKETREKLMALFLKTDGRKYLVNDTKQGHY